MSTKVSIIDGKPFVQIDGETLSPPEAILMLREKQADTYEELHQAETALADAERNHGAALADGKEPDRDIVTAAKASIDQAQGGVKTIEADLSRIHSKIIDHEAALIFDTAIADIERDTRVRPDLNENLARNTAELGLRFAVADAEYKAALADVDAVQARVEGIGQQISKITQQRLEGDATAGNAAELAALGFDVRALQKIMGEAKQKAASIDPHELRSQHQRAVVDWGKHIQDARLKALAAVVQSREKELVDALTKLVDNASVSGIQTITDLWRPSDPLHVFVTRTLLSALPRGAA
jgi:hypothetical protein